MENLPGSSEFGKNDNGPTLEEWEAIDREALRRRIRREELAKREVEHSDTNPEVPLAKKPE
jgi:hypothetical protein